jgi:cytoskeletal protein RodZ
MDANVKRVKNHKSGMIFQLILAFIVAVTAVLLWLFVKSLSPAAEKDRMVVPAPPQVSSDPQELLPMGPQRAVSIDTIAPDTFQ